MRATRALSRLAALSLVAALACACSSAASSANTSRPPTASSASTAPSSSSSPATSSSSPTAAPTSALATSAAAVPVPAALSFGATTVDGAAFSGAELAGTRTVLWFWAPWCTVCARATAGVKAAAATLAPDVRVVGVAGLSSDATDMRRFVDRSGLQAMTTLADTGGDLYARFGVTQQDTFVLIAPDGTVSKHPAYSQDVDLVALARQTFG